MIIRPPTHAVNSFSQDAPVLFDNVPLHKFNYAVVFNINPVSGIDFDVERMVVIVKTANIGGWDIETDVTNEYNRKRLTHTKLNFQDTTIVMHDVADGKALRLAEKYYTYYFGDGRDVVGFGYDTLLIPDNNRRYIFDSIDIYQFQARKANLTTLVNPKLVSFTPDTADYAGIDGLMELSFTFKPEYITYERNIGLPPEILNQMERGGTPEQLANTVETFLDTATTVPKDSDILRAEALDQLNRNTEAAIQERVIQRFDGTAFTARSVNRLQRGSLTTRASSSTLDAYGRLTSELRRKLPESTQGRSNNTFNTVPRRREINKPDGTAGITERNNDPNFQGGDN